MMAREPVPPFEADRVAWAEHEHPALLEGPPAPRTLTEALRESADAVDDAPWMKCAGHAVRQPGGAIRLERGIDEEPALIARRGAELQNRGRLGVADDDQASAETLDVRGGGAETSYQLATEDSAEVANEGHDSSPDLPEAPERNGLTVLIERGQRGESGRDRRRHGGTVIDRHDRVQHCEIRACTTLRMAEIEERHGSETGPGGPRARLAWRTRTTTRCGSPTSPAARCGRWGFPLLGHRTRASAATTPPPGGP